MHGTRRPLSAKPDSRSISIRIARDPNDLMLVAAIRAAVYLAEQDCPIDEEFDGNDLVAAHFIGFIGAEPAACLRVRFFGEFAKIERLAVRHQFRRSRISFKLVQASFEYLKRKVTLLHVPANAESTRKVAARRRLDLDELHCQYP